MIGLLLQRREGVYRLVWVCFENSAIYRSFQQQVNYSAERKLCKIRIGSASTNYISIRNIQSILALGGAAF